MVILLALLGVCRDYLLVEINSINKTTIFKSKATKKFKTKLNIELLI